MAQATKNPNQWPKAFVAIFGTALIATCAYLTKEPNIMWTMILLIYLTSNFD